MRAHIIAAQGWRRPNRAVGALGDGAPMAHPIGEPEGIVGVLAEVVEQPFARALIDGKVEPVEVDWEADHR